MELLLLARLNLVVDPGTHPGYALVYFATADGTRKPRPPVAVTLTQLEVLRVEARYLAEHEGPDPERRSR